MEKKLEISFNAITGETTERELTAEEIAELPTSTETDIPQDETPIAD